MKPYVKGETLKAADFAPMGDAPSINDGEPMLCHVCQAMMLVKPFQSGPRAAAVGSPSVVPQAEPGTRTLFEVRDGEQLLCEPKISGTGIVVITNKRILMIEV